jgi:hypothetical protein
MAKKGGGGLNHKHKPRQLAIDEDKGSRNQERKIKGKQDRWSHRDSRKNERRLGSIYQRFFRISPPQREKKLLIGHPKGKTREFSRAHAIDAAATLS